MAQSGQRCWDGIQHAHRKSHKFTTAASLALQPKVRRVKVKTILAVFWGVSCRADILNGLNRLRSARMPPCPTQPVLSY